jgi:hypothetical protein
MRSRVAVGLMMPRHDKEKRHARVGDDVQQIVDTVIAGPVR